MCNFWLSTPSDVQNLVCSPPLTFSPFKYLVLCRASHVWLLCGTADGRPVNINSLKSGIKGNIVPNLSAEGFREEKKLSELVLNIEKEVLIVSLMKMMVEEHNSQTKWCGLQM